MIRFITPAKPATIIIGLLLFAGTVLAETTEWSLESPDKKCEITVSLDSGRLSYYTSLNGKVVIAKSPLGLKRNDQDFENGLVFEHAGDVEKRREKYELFAGVQPSVNHRINYRELAFHNANGIPIKLDLAASDEGVAFRYRFAETNSDVRIVESELSSFAVPMNA